MSLSSNQLLLLGAVVNASVPATTESLAELKNEHGHEYGENAARNCMSRLEARGFVVGSGRGRRKVWSATPQGAAAYRELATAPEHEEESKVETPVEDKGPRTYVVLEACSLADALAAALPEGYAVPDDLYEVVEGQKVYDLVQTVTARNTEHALRQTAKAAYSDSTDAPMLVAVATKMWKPTPVRLNNRPTVSIG